jgi:hypothetical protein
MFQKDYLFLPCQPDFLTRPCVSSYHQQGKKKHLREEAEPKKESTITSRTHLIMFVMNRINPFITHL